MQSRPDPDDVAKQSDPRAIKGEKKHGGHGGPRRNTEA